MAENLYSELQAMSNFSFLQAASHPEELVLRAAALKMKAIAITDINSVTGLVRAHLTAKENKIKLIVGTRLRFEDGPDLLIYPTDRLAYSHLIKLITLGKRRAPKGKCKLYLSDLNTNSFSYGAGQIVIIVSPHFSFRANRFIYHKVKSKNQINVNKVDSVSERKCIFEEQLSYLKTIFFKNIYLSATLDYTHQNNMRLDTLFKLSKHHGVPLVATNDVLIHLASRKPLLDILTCMRYGIHLNEAGYLLAANAERHLKSPSEMNKLFKEYPDAISRTLEITSRCKFSLDELSYEYPVDSISISSTPADELARFVNQGAKKRYPNSIPSKVRKQIKHELRIINSLGFAAYFLTVFDIVRFAANQNIFCQGRGSAANSAVCYCLGITAVDPERVELLFERFISIERRGPPDIDIDFENSRREEIIQYIYKKYGRSRAGMTATVITYKKKSALRDVGKAFGLSNDCIAALQSAAWRRKWEHITDRHITDVGLNPASRSIRMTIALAREIEGFPRHLSQHVGGIVISKEPLNSIVPIANATMIGRTIIEWDKNDLATLGILKIDILALGMLSCIHNAFDLINRHYGKKYHLTSVPSEDSMVFDMLCKADSVGVFQVESRAQMSMLPRLKPRNFYDLVIQVAIVRPGPIQGNMVHPYLRRRSGKETTLLPSKKLNSVLGKTLGIPLFQEQAMKIAIVAASFTPEEADALRRTLATFKRFGDINSFRKRFLSGMRKNGYSSKFSESCFEQIASFANYGFPESHAASFALLVYISAWIKYHYPAVFTCALLNCQPMGFYSPSQLIRDAKEHNVKIEEICINSSYWTSTLEQYQNRTNLRLGFGLIKGIKKDDITRLIALRDTPYRDICELYNRTRLSKITLEKLARADAFRSFGFELNEALWIVKGIEDNREFPLVADVKKRERSIYLPTFSLSKQISEDYKTKSFSLKAHPLFPIRKILKDKGYVKCNKLIPNCDTKKIKIAGLVITRQQPVTAKGTMFITIEDESAIANLIIWPNILEKFRHNILFGNILGVIGKVQSESMVTHLLVQEVTNLSDLIQ